MEGMRLRFAHCAAGTTSPHFVLCTDEKEDTTQYVDLIPIFMNIFFSCPFIWLEGPVETLARNWALKEHRTAHAAKVHPITLPILGQHQDAEPAYSEVDIDFLCPAVFVIYERS